MNYKICIVGLGYVGLPLAVAFASKFEVIGIDLNKERIKELKNNLDQTLEVDEHVLKSVNKKISYSANIEDAKSCNIYIITVPTPIDELNRPNLQPLINSSRSVGSVLSNDNIVIYESTVYPGVTEEVCVPELESFSGLKFNEDFYCGYSPERINPGDKKRTLTKIPKITSGSTPDIAKLVDELYGKIIEAGTHMVSTIKIAEAAKVIENVQRDVNIALINELAIIFDHMKIDTQEVLEAAATKWNFIKLLPGLVGGHCIGVDPYYISFKSEEIGYRPDLILTARHINNGMSKFIADQTIKEIINAGKNVKKSKILILGLSFKENCPDMRNTKVIGIIEELKRYVSRVDVYDPWVNIKKESSLFHHGIVNDPLKSDTKYDAVVIAVAHDHFRSYKEADFDNLMNGKRIIIDVKGITDFYTWRL